MPKKPPEMPGKPWYAVLLAARKASLDRKRPFTASDVAREAGIKGTKVSSAERIASAWLGKFHRWGYVLRTGSAKGEKRWIGIYEMTDWGMRFKPSDKKIREKKEKKAAGPEKT
jgi:hypothetical protein